MTDAVTDTFTDADDTVVSTGHAGEVGATWAINTSYGPGTADEFLIRSNSLARSIYPQPDSTGEALIYPSGTLPGGTTDFMIEFSVVWDAQGDGSFLDILEDAATPGGGKAVIVELSYASWGIGSAPNGIYYQTGFVGGLHVGYDFATFTPSVGHTYLVQIEIHGTAASLTIDGVVMATWTRAAPPVEAFGIDMYDSSGVGEMRVLDYRVYPAASSPAPRPVAFIAT